MLSYHDLEDFMGINDALTDSRVKHHETVTAYYVGAVHALVDRSLDELVAHPACSRAAPLSHWSRERLFSVAARRRWVPPDLAPLPWWTPGPAGTSGAEHGAPAAQPLG